MKKKNKNKWIGQVVNVSWGGTGVQKCAIRIVWGILKCVEIHPKNIRIGQRNKNVKDKNSVGVDKIVWKNGEWINSEKVSIGNGEWGWSCILYAKKRAHSNLELQARYTMRTPYNVHTHKKTKLNFVVMILKELPYTVS